MDHKNLFDSFCLLNSYNIIYLFETETRVQCEMLGFVSKAAAAFVANATVNGYRMEVQCNNDCA